MTLKKRYWLAVLYPGESAPDNWRSILEDTHIPMAVSPLHDCDTNADGEVKKPHRHLLIAYEGPTTYNNVKSMLEPIGGPNPIPCESVRGAFRYLTHRDNPEKYQYDSKDIICLNGFSEVDYVGLTSTEVTAIIRKMQQIVRENKFCRVNELADYLLDNDLADEYDVLINHTYFMKCYLDGMYRTRAEEKEERFKKMGVLMDGINDNKICATIIDGKKKK